MNIDQYYETRTMSKEDVELMIEYRELFEQHVTQVANAVGKVQGKSPADVGDCTSVDFGYNVVLSWEEYHCSCCGPDYDEMSFPIEYLYRPLDEVLAELEEERRVEAEKKKQADIEKKAKATAERERKEYEKYLTMKEKYEK